jgi:hypothetical protein
LGSVGVDFDDSVAFADRELLAGKELIVEQAAVLYVG